MNIAFEISPLITASGTFGDKSGVYRYTTGLLLALSKTLIEKDPGSQIYLFTFAPQLLKYSLSPEILSLIDHKNITLLGYSDKLILHAKDNEYLELLNVPYLKQVLKLADKLLSLREHYKKMQQKKQFKHYVNWLRHQFIQTNVKAVFHSETGFYPMQDLTNIITIYDLTTVLLGELHREATCDLHSRKIRFAKKMCEAVLSISESTKNDLKKYSKPFKRKDIIVAYPGLDEIFLNDEKIKTYKITQLNQLLPNGKTIEEQKYLLYFGTFEPRKNLGYLVRAYAELLERGEIPADFKLVMIGGTGWGGVKQRIEDFIRENYPITFNNNFIILDYANDFYLKGFIKHAYAVVYPSLYEGFGLPVLESMAMGTPVICSDTSSLPEVGGDAVLYTNPKDYFGLKDQIKRLIHDPKLAAELSEKGLEQSEKFRWEKTAETVYSFLNSLKSSHENRL